MKISASAKLQLCFASLIRDRARSSVCILTIAAGVMSLCLFEGFNSGALWSYQERVVRTRMGHFQIERNVDPAVLSTDAAARDIPNVEELTEKIKTIPEVEGVFQRLRFSALLVNDQANVPVIVEGIQAEGENKFFNELEYTSGRALSGAPDEILLGEGAAKALGLQVGSHVTLMGYTLRGSLNALDLQVVGTFSGGVKEFDESFVRIPLGAAQSLLDWKGTTAVVIGLKNSEALGTGFAKINDVTGGNKEVLVRDFKDLDRVYYGNAVGWLKAQFFFIRLIIVLIVILGILNTVNITIFERTAEIGTYRAMGFSKRFVRGQILREYFLMGIIGGGLGIGAALLLAKVALSQGVPMPPSPGATRGLSVLLRIEPMVIALNLLLAIVASLIATYFPAKRAVKMPIIEALGHRL